MDVRIINPHAPTYRNQSMPACYKSHERTKKRAYEQCICEVEHATFTPLVLSAPGGLANEASHFYKRVASQLAAKWDQSYSHTLSLIRCRLTFSLSRSAIQCTRRARSSIGCAQKHLAPVDLVTTESHVNVLSAVQTF